MARTSSSPASYLGFFQRGLKGIKGSDLILTSLRLISSTAYRHVTFYFANTVTCADRDITALRGQDGMSFMVIDLTLKNNPVTDDWHPTLPLPYLSDKNNQRGWTARDVNL